MARARRPAAAGAAAPGRMPVLLDKDYASLRLRDPGAGARQRRQDRKLWNLRSEPNIRDHGYVDRGSDHDLRQPEQSGECKYTGMQNMQNMDFCIFCMLI